MVQHEAKSQVPQGLSSCTDTAGKSFPSKSVLTQISNCNSNNHVSTFCVVIYLIRFDSDSSTNTSVEY